MSRGRLVWGAGLLRLALGASALGQTPPAVVQPGTPSAPEIRGLRIPQAEPIPGNVPASQPAPPSTPPSSLAETAGPPYTVTLLGRQACVTPTTQGLARAEGGYIDVAVDRAGVMTMTMTGSTAANSYLGTTGMACETFQLTQEIEIAASDPKTRFVVLTLDSALVGMLRSKRKAVACVERAELTLTPVGCQCPPIGLAHPPGCVEGGESRLCNQHLPPLRTPPLPLGRYVLSGWFVIRCSGSGLCDGHAVADFSPDTSQPPEWVRVRDPFQGVAKKPFGFVTTITLEAPKAEEIGVGARGRGRAEPEVRQVRLDALADRRQGSRRPGPVARPPGGRDRKD